MSTWKTSTSRATSIPDRTWPGCLNRDLGNWGRITEGRRCGSAGVSPAIFLLTSSPHKNAGGTPAPQNPYSHLKRIISVLTITFVVRNLASQGYFERGLAIIFLYCSASLGAQIISIVDVPGGSNFKRNLSRASQGSV